MLIGYSRVSSVEQSTCLQIEQLQALGCEKIFKENQSGKSADRKQLKKMLNFARSGDTIFVMKVDRLARNTIDALKIADQLKENGVGLVFQDLSGVDINSDVGRVIYTTISAFAEMERKRILQRCNEGRAKAKAEGKNLGRHKDIKMHEKVKKLNDAGAPKTAIAKQLNISRQTVYSVIKR
jgi:DNA invertase Pin-like site-specific DNA recombinase